MKQGFIFAAEVGHSKVYLLIIKNKESSSKEIKVNNSQALPVKHQIGQEEGCHLFPPHRGVWVKQEGQTIRGGSKKRIKTT